LARDLVHRAAVIATYDTASALAAKAGTRTIPIIFATGADPVKFGLVASLARPGANVTGVSFLINALGSKRLELLRELVPTAATFGFLVDPSNPNSERETADMQAAADLLGHKLLVLKVSTVNEIDAAFATFIQQRVDALAVAGQAFLGGRAQQIAELALRHRLPTISYNREYAAAGGLISYSGSLTEAFRQQGIYTARILRGDEVSSSHPSSSEVAARTAYPSRGRMSGLDANLFCSAGGGNWPEPEAARAAGGLGSTCRRSVGPNPPLVTHSVSLPPSIAALQKAH
jgi:putative tryptophan/tyrosine transport system substrate-binding protein